MKRPSTKQSPGPCAESKRLVAWIVERSICAGCGSWAPLIIHHVSGSSAKIRVVLERVMIGHFFVNGLCQCCEHIVTHQSRRRFRELYGNECDCWARQVEDYPGDIPDNVREGIRLWGK